VAVDAQGKFAWTGKGCVREKDQPSKQANHTYAFMSFLKSSLQGCPQSMLLFILA